GPAAAVGGGGMNDKVAKGLGRGLSALLDENVGPPSADSPAQPSGGVREIEVGRIRPNSHQPRMQFSEESIDELADSITQRGVLQSLLQDDISMGHARAVATAPDPEALTREIIAKGLSVRQAEQRVRRAKEGPGELVLVERKVDADLAALERQLGDMLGLKVE